MQSFTWDKHFITGLSIVDEQHLSLVNLINEFGNCLAKNEINLDEIEKVYKQLAEYAAFHFKDEEANMARFGIDSRHLNVHIRTHRSFLGEVNQMHSNISSDNPESARHLLDFLTHWLAYHILGSDQNMARQIKAIQSGVSPAEAYAAEELGANSSTEPLLMALNGLFHQVSSRNKELVKLNRSLEARVEQRTRALRDANQKLEEIALTDALTGLPNRRAAMRRLGELWEETATSEKALACMMIDADLFKRVNDRYGHDAGDDVLRELSNILQDSVRSDDLVCRLGGDEFLIICANTDLEGALIVAKNLCDRVSAMQVVTGDGYWQGSVSVGVAMRSASMLNQDDLIKSADKGVYIAKKDGKNCVRYDKGTIFNQT